MKNTLKTLIFTGLVAGAMLSGTAFAQDDNVPGHPRVNEVNQRLENQQNRIDAGENKGQMTPGQAQRDENRDSRISREESRDEAEHGGHLTKREDRHLNKQLNHNSHDIHRQRHHRKHRHHEHPGAQ